VIDESTDAAEVSLLDLFRLDGKVAVVTGAGRGIGRGIAIGLADAGASVVLTARRVHELESVAEVIRGKGGQAEVIPGDIREEEVVQRLVSATVERFGRLDIWVSNAGTSDHPGNFPFVDFPTWHWDNQLALNLRPHFLAAKACLSVMEPGSSIIGISSIAALHGSVRFAGYGAAKAGMNQLTQTLAAELGPRGIRANVVSPGQVPTEATRTVGGMTDDMIPAMRARIPIGRLGTPTDVAAAVVWLASPAGSWVTGQNIVVAGGQG
jgi:7-alpha-hydroxysteroid dehydrogenase